MCKKNTVIGILLLAVFLLNGFPAYGQETSAGLPFALRVRIDSHVGYQSFDWDSDVKDDEERSNVYVRYADLRIIYKPNQHVEGFLLLRNEQKFVHVTGRKFHMDEGWVKLMNHGAYMKVGRIDMSFSNIGTHTVEKSYTWWLADLVKVAFEAGYQNDYVHIAGVIFNGTFENVDDEGETDDDVMSDYTARINLSPLADMNDHNLNIGGGWVSDIAETEIGFGEDYFIPGSLYEDPVSAYAVYVTYEGPVGDSSRISFIGEYVESDKFPDDVYVDLEGDKTGIAGANIELAYINDGRWWIGGKYQMMDGFDWWRAHEIDPELTPTRFETYGGFCGLALNDNTSMDLEVRQGHDDDGSNVFESYFRVRLKF